MRFLAGLVFAAIVACGIDLQFVRQLPDFGPTAMLQYDYFLIEAAKRTPPGASIAIYVHTPKFDPNYAFYYYRGAYQLAGRRVIPLRDADDREHPERLATADYIAAWGTNEVLPHAVVYRGHHGALYRSAN